MSDRPAVVHDPRRHAFVLRAGDEDAGYAQYEPRGSAMAITHVVVDPAHAGKGYGKVLAEAALADARERGLDVLPVCSFLRAHVRRHPEHLDLVPEEVRSRFGLAA